MSDWMEIFVFGFPGFAIATYGLTADKPIFVSMGLVILAFTYVIAKIDREVDEITAELRGIWDVLSRLKDEEEVEG